MKLKAAYSAVKLAVGTTAALVAASVSAIRLAVVASALRVSVEVGIFLQKLGLQDTVAYSELVARLFSRGTSDVASIADLVNTEVQHSVPELLWFSDGDQPYFAEVYVLNAFGMQDYTLGATIPKDVGKVLNDELLVTFSILATVDVSMDRVVQDPVSAIDAYAATINRSVADGYNAVDSAVRAVEKSFADALQVAATAEALLVVSRVVDDSSAASDAPVVVPTKVAAEAVPVSETATATVGKFVADATSAASATAMRFERSLADFIAVADAMSTGSSGVKEYDSASAVTDAARVSVEKLISDAIAATASAITDILTTEESATPTYAADSAVRGIGPNRNDSASAADSGSVRSQGYVDFTYMAEDYVGAYTTF